MDYKEVKKRHIELWRLESEMAKLWRLNPQWRQTPEGQNTLERYSKAVDEVIECSKYFTKEEIVAYCLAPDLGYGGSF